MITETIQLIKLTASEGMVLTNGEAYSSVGGDVFLGCSDSVTNWHEITEETYNAIQESEKNRTHPEELTENG